CRWYGPILTGIDPRTETTFVDIAFFAGKGGSGASLGCDGWDHLGLLRNAGGVASQDIEFLESQDPIRVEANELVTDSGGPGKWRGGLGVKSEWISYAKNASVVVYGETLVPSGLQGGLSPNLKSFGKIIDPSGRVTQTADFGIYPIKPGTKLKWFVTGGGGFGNPRERSPEQVKRDLDNQKIGLRTARKYYRFRSIRSYKNERKKSKS
ncbi:MAG: hydantoinase B/oxoprolinase family protein, partial [Thaumarchaeota archaeon]|nr:hydantoinase B/oxoprolinase family protein [Nitrososphaerota archaeon]